MCVRVCMCLGCAPVFGHQCLLGRVVLSSAPGLRSRWGSCRGACLPELVFLLKCGLLHRRRPFYNIFLPAFTFLNSGSSIPLAEGTEALMGAGLFLSSWRGLGSGVHLLRGRSEVGLSLRQALAGSGWWISSTLTVLLNVMISDHLAKATQSFLRKTLELKNAGLRSLQ